VAEKNKNLSHVSYQVPDVMQHVMDATEAVTHQCEKILETMATESQNEITSQYTNLEVGVFL
jgi:hypothetical protein